MAYGLEVLNDSGFTQIGDSLSNLLVVASGTTTNGGIVNFPTGVTGSSVFVFAKPADTGTYQQMVGFVDRINNRFRLWRTNYTQYSNPWTDPFQSAAAAPTGTITGTPATAGDIDYVVCVEPKDVADPNDPYGLEVYNASGDIIFHTSSAVMDITHIHQFETQASYSTSNLLATFTVAGGEDVADYYVLVNATSTYRAVTVGPSRILLRYNPTCTYDHTANTIKLDRTSTGGGPNQSVPFNYWGESQRTLLIGKLSS